MGGWPVAAPLWHDGAEEGARNECENEQCGRKTVADGQVVGGVALASLATTGCDRVLEMQVVALAAEVAMFPDETLAVVSRLAGNHNETFLISG